MPIPPHSITLRFHGDDLEPAALTAALGGAPTKSARSSDLDVKTGYWEMTTTWEATADSREWGVFGPRLLELFAPLSTDLDVWRTLAQRYNGSVLFRADLHARSAAMFLTAAAMAALSERGLGLTFVARDR